MVQIVQKKVGGIGTQGGEEGEPIGWDKSKFFRLNYPKSQQCLKLTCLKIVRDVI